MKIGVVRTDDLPSTSIGLRVYEMKRLGFDRIVLYAKTRISVAKQFRDCIVATTEKQLYDAVAENPSAMVVVDSRCPLDKECMQALGEPAENETRCLVGHKFVESVAIGDRNIVKMYEYDRRRSVARYSGNDSGDTRVDTVDLRGPFSMRAGAFSRMVESGDGFLRGGVKFQEQADSLDMKVVCSDPIVHGVKWESVVNKYDKKPNNVVYGERPRTREEQPNTEIRTQPYAPPDMTCEPVRESADAPVLSVVFQTHNRTATACYCLNALCRNLRYAGRIHYCICDDRSKPGHVGALVSVLRGNGIGSFSVHTATDKRWGLGASINNGIHWSFRFTDTVLTIEDDFLLKKPFDATPYVEELKKPDVAMIKLAANSESFNPLMECGHPGFRQVTSNMKKPRCQRFTFNNLVALRHKRVFDEIGPYLENRSPEIMETDAITRFNDKFDCGFSARMKILWPNVLRRNTYDTEWFMHIGKSTVGHAVGTATQRGYEYLADPGRDEAIASASMAHASKTFHVVVPCFNNPKLLKRCLDSIAGQTRIDDLMVTVVDDVSSPENALEIADTVCSFPFAVFMPLHDKGMAGGARNHGVLRSVVSSEYTMFVDSDDELFSSDAMERIENAIKANGRPDVVCLGYVSRRTGTVHKAAQSVEKMAVAPWSRCVKTNKVCRFEEGRRICNDTMQFLRTVDSVKTVAHVEGPVIVYNADNPDSGWSNDSVRMTKAAVDAMLMTVSDMLFEKYEGQTARTAAKRALVFIEKHLEESLSALKRRL